MSPVRTADRDAATDGGRADAGDYASAILNILEDFAGEKDRMADTQRAALNILDDFDMEKARMADTQRAALNILDDFAEEKDRMADTQRAALNILDDFGDEIAVRTRTELALGRAKTAAEAASRELEAFSYSVAHDLRAPLRSIDGFSQALLEDCADRLDDDGRKYLQRVRQSAQQMGALIDDLLNLSRVTRAELRRAVVDVSALARSVLARLKDSQPERTVETVVQDGLKAEADPRLLEIVLTNLLGNAWKFTGKRAAARIEFGAEDGSRPTTFFVRDNGAGFDVRYADKLFGVFQRLHAASEFDGTGIGLATVQRIVARHGGRVWAESELDRGATFRFTIEEAVS